MPKPDKWNYDAKKTYIDKLREWAYYSTTTKYVKCKMFQTIYHQLSSVSYHKPIVSHPRKPLQWLLSQMLFLPPSVL